MRNQGFLILILIVILFSISQNNNHDPQTQQQSFADFYVSEDVIGSIIDSKVAFSATDMFRQGVGISGETARIILFNSDVKDLGSTNMDGTSFNTQPNHNYKFYYFMSGSQPSSSYYSFVEDYIAPNVEGVDNKVVYGCSIDTAPFLVAKDEYGRIQSNGNNDLVLGANEVKDASISIKASNDKCFGTPSAPESNAVCFAYDATYYDSIKMSTGYVSVPNSVVTQSNVSSMAVNCYKFPVIKDLESREFSVTIDTSTNNPGTGQDILVVVDDIALDLDRTTNEEIWGYVDENNNQLAMDATVIGTIQVS